MLELPSDGQLQGEKINYKKWNMLIKIARKYEKDKHDNNYSDLSGFAYFLGSLGNSIVLNTDEPKIKPNYCKYYSENDWINIWKMVNKEYGKQFVEDFKKCLSILKKYIENRG